MFVNKYYMHFGYNLTFSNYLLIKDYITEQIDHLIMYENIELYDLKEVYDFIMFTLLKKYSIEEILSKKHNLEVKNSIKYFNTKQKQKKNNSIEHNPAKKYIYDSLVEIKGAFTKRTKLDEVTSRMYMDLKHLGYNDEDILNQDCDYTMIELLRGHGLGIDYKEDFLEYRKKIEYKVSNLFTKHKLDIIRRNPNRVRSDMSYQFYNSSYHQMNTAFKAALSFYLSGYSLKEANNQEIDRYINDFITRDMIQLNSTVELKENRYAATKVQTAEEKAYAEQLAKQKAAIWAIILSGLVLGSAVHKIIWNLPFEDKDKKEKSSFQDSNELKTIIESKLGFAYDAENNTFSMGGK
jgi:hypothetical protein